MTAMHTIIHRRMACDRVIKVTSGNASHINLTLASANDRNTSRSFLAWLTLSDIVSSAGSPKGLFCYMREEDKDVWNIDGVSIGERRIAR